MHPISHGNRGHATICLTLNSFALATFVPSIVQVCTPAACGKEGSSQRGGTVRNGAGMPYLLCACSYVSALCACSYGYVRDVSALHRAHFRVEAFLPDGAFQDDC
eukprot:6195065-Pleurochrysis_carterae.AAC.1